MKKFWEKHKDTVIIYLLALAFAVVAAILTATSLSFLYPGTNLDSLNYDSNFFRYEGYLISKGETPYIDFYDHKGIYSPLINALGLLIGGRYGLFIVDCLFSSFSLFFLFLSLRELGKGKIQHLLIAASFYTLFLSFMTARDNDPGYILPFVSSSFYFAFKAVKNDEVKSLYISGVLMGIQVGLTINARMSDASWGAGLALFYLIWLVKEKRYRHLLFTALFAIGGLAVTCSIFLFIALGGGYLNEMMKAIFVDGFHYLFSDAGNEYIVHQWGNRIAVLLIAIIGIFIYHYERKKVKETEGEKRNYLPDFFAFNLFFACLIYFIIARFTHYYYCAVCFVILYIFYLASFWSIKKWKSFFSPLIYGSTVVGVASVLLSMYYGFGGAGFSYARSQAIKDDVYLISEEERKEKGNILALDLDTGVYLVAEATTDFRYYAYQSWWNDKVIDVSSAVNAYLASRERPTYLLVSNSELTWTNFGEAVRTYYSPYQPEKIKNDIFTIYKAVE